MLLERKNWVRAFHRVRQSLRGGMAAEALLDGLLEFYYLPAPPAAPGPCIRILYVAMRDDYGNPRRGLSYEENNFWHALVHSGYQMIRFDYMRICKRYGRAQMNRMLLETAYRWNPDVMFTVLFNDELDPTVIDRISRELPTVTVNWFCDDHWRFDNFSLKWAPYFNWVITTAASAVERYVKAGITRVIYSQWACNHFLYRNLGLPKQYDVTFVGQPHGNRRGVIDALRQAGIDVRVWGYGWGTGRVTQAEMIRIFNQRKINLNLSNAAWGDVAQIKGRDFEVPGCGGFLLTAYSDELERYYLPGVEVETYRSLPEMIEKIRYYLAHDDERERIANLGYQRTLRDHTYQHRFATIFQKMEVIGSAEAAHPAHSAILSSSGRR